MKKFIANITIFTVIISVIVLIINYAYINLDRSDSDRIKKFKSVPDNIEICNLGSSHGMFGFNYEDIKDEYTCFNFGLPGQTLSYDYRILQAYSDRLSTGSIVFIPVSFHVVIGEDEEEFINFNSKNRRYYSILPKEYIKSYDLVTEVYVKYLPSLTKRVDLISTILGYNKTNSFEIVWSKEATLEDTEYRIKNLVYGDFLRKGKIDDNGNWIINENEVTALYSMIEFCKDKEFIPILVIPPFPKAYTDTMYSDVQGFINLFYEIIGEIIEETTVELYDFSIDDRFSEHPELFFDTSHLNKYGAKQLVDILYEEVISKYK